MSLATGSHNPQGAPFLDSSDTRNDGLAAAVLFDPIADQAMVTCFER